jgi:chitinase
MKASLSCVLIWIGLAVAASSYESSFLAQARQSTRQKLSTRDDSDPKCTKDTPCKIGCCGPLYVSIFSNTASTWSNADEDHRDKDTGIGICGLGPTFCGDGCTSSCDYKSECDPGWGIQWSNASACPLNVCCSDYGFCGTTDDFCKGRQVSVPQCDAAANSSHARTIGYYEGWNWQRPCGTMKPSQIPLGYYSHIFFAFSLLDPTTFRLSPMDTETGTLYGDVSAIKNRQPGVQVWIAVGGWAMNDPGATRTTFSNVAKSEAAQDEFFEALVTFMMANDYDGVDIDWEYPVADDRGGIEEDFGNYVTLLKRLRARLNNLSVPKGLSITLPASYWYLRGFDIVNLEPYVDFFNVMTYDIRE